MSDRKTLRDMLSKAAKAIRCPAARQRFRQMLADMDDDAIDPNERQDRDAEEDRPARPTR